MDAKFLGRRSAPALHGVRRRCHPDQLREPELDPVTAYVEDSAGAILYESEEDVDPMSAIFDRLLDRCLTPDMSRTVLRTVESSPTCNSLPQ